MNCQNYIISKHALSRIIERLVMCQNIKLSKKQRNNNEKRAKQVIAKDLTNKFATANSENGLYEYVYTNMDKNNRCKKYVITIDDRIIVTVINDIDLSQEIKNNNICFKPHRNQIIKMEKFCISDYIYTLINDRKYLIVVDSRTGNICSMQMIEGC